MKVLHFTHYAKGGIISVIRDQIVNSVNQSTKYCVLVVCRIDEDLKALAERHNIEIYSLPPSWYSLIGDVLGCFRLVKMLQPDIIHTHSYYPRVLTALLMYAPGLGKPKLVTTIHNDYPYFHRSDLKSIIKRFTEKLSINITKSFVACVSQSVHSAVMRNLGVVLNTYVVSNGVPLGKRDRHPLWDKPTGTVVVISVGRLSGQKNYSFLLDCWADFIVNYPGAVLWLVGDGEERHLLEQKALDLGLSSSVRFWGWQCDVSTFLKQAHVFVLSSLHEGFNLSILQALGHGLGVVSTAVSGIDEVIIDHHSGIVVPQKDKQKMVQALLELADDSALREKLGSNGQSEVFDKYSIVRYVKEIEMLYEKVLSSRNDRATCQ